jgi:hypothetical protein
MLYITNEPPNATPNNDDNKRKLARLRRAAKERGFRILKDWTGAYSLVDATPPQTLIGLFQVSPEQIGAALSKPLAPPKTRARKPTAVTNRSPEIEQLFQKLRTEGGAS